jgi:7,8-dihydropterin-6-yl-methyl-4-(beta-D-ribofuranosyl)aminobenzene 5'-phosphate synthase
MQIEEKISPEAFKNLSIGISYDNNPYNEELVPSWGFSCFIRGLEKNILFDTGGDGDLLLANMGHLGMDLEEIDLLVLSHIHGDHVGGIQALIEKNPRLVVFLPRSFPTSFKDKLKGCCADVVEIHEPFRICKGVYSTGELGRSVEEQSLILNTHRGAVVITACAHPGILKILKSVEALVDKGVFFLMGGFHLLDEHKSEMEKIVAGIRRLGVSYVAPCHCSGTFLKEALRIEYGNNFIEVGVGRIITLPDLS